MSEILISKHMFDRIFFCDFFAILEIAFANTLASEKIDIPTPSCVALVAEIIDLSLQAAPS